MSENINVIYAEGLALLEQALRINQVKSFDDYPSLNKLSDGMPFLLELANNNKALTDIIAKRYELTAEVIKSAAIDYLKAAYLQHTDNPYRVLGLSPWSTMDEVKKRHRFLIRLFHPDRGMVKHSSEVDFAANINHAHTSICNKVKGAATRLYQSQPYAGEYDADGKQSSQSLISLVPLFGWLQLGTSMAIKWLAEVDYRRHAATGYGLFWRLSDYVYVLLKLIFTYAVQFSIFTAYILQHGIRYAAKFSVVLLRILQHAFTHAKRQYIYLFQLFMCGITKLMPKLSAVFSATIDYQYTSLPLKLLAIATVSIGFVMVGGVEYSQKTYMDAEQYFSAKQLVSSHQEILEQAAQQLTQKEEQARKDTARQLALKQAQAREEVERNAAQKAEAVRQLAIRQESERMAEEKAETARQLALKQEAERKEAIFLNAETDGQALVQKDSAVSRKKTARLRLSRELIDASTSEAQSTAGVPEIRIDKP